MQNIPIILLPWYFLSAATTLDLFSFCWIYLFFGLVEAKTLPQSLSFLQCNSLKLCTHKFRLCFAVGKKRKHWFAIIFSFWLVSYLQSIWVVRTARIIIRGLKPAQHFHDIYWLKNHRNLKNRGRKAICKLQHWYGDSGIPAMIKN